MVLSRLMRGWMKVQYYFIPIEIRYTRQYIVKQRVSAITIDVEFINTTHTHAQYVLQCRRGDSS